MKLRRKMISLTTAVCLVLVPALSAGCDGENLNLNFILPLGLGGSPGFYNPFGIVQAFVNAWLGTVLPGSGGSSSSSGTGATGSPSPTPTNIGAIGAVVTQAGT